MTLDTLGAEHVETALRVAYERLHVANDPRTPAQQRADALVEICRQLHGVPARVASDEPAHSPGRRGRGDPRRHRRWGMPPRGRVPDLTGDGAAPVVRRVRARSAYRRRWCGAGDGPGDQDVSRRISTGRWWCGTRTAGARAAGSTPRTAKRITSTSGNATTEVSTDLDNGALFSVAGIVIGCCTKAAGRSAGARTVSSSSHDRAGAHLGTSTPHRPPEPILTPPRPRPSQTRQPNPQRAPTCRCAPHDGKSARASLRHLPPAHGAVG